MSVVFDLTRSPITIEVAGGKDFGYITGISKQHSTPAPETQLVTNVPNMGGASLEAGIA